MIGIQYHSIRPHLYDSYRHLLTRTIVHCQLHPYLRLHIRRKTIYRKLNDRLRVPRSIGIFHRDLYGLFLPNSHTKDAVIETLYHHTAAHFELQRAAPLRAIKCCPIGQTSVIMDFYSIANFYFLCHMFYFFFN